MIWLRYDSKEANMVKISEQMRSQVAVEQNLQRLMRLLEARPLAIGEVRYLIS